MSYLFKTVLDQYCFHMITHKNSPNSFISLYISVGLPDNWKLNYIREYTISIFLSLAC